MSGKTVKDFQDILDAYFEEYTEFALTGQNQPNFSTFTKELDDLGKDVRDAYIKENEIPHILNMFSPTQNMLRAEERNAGKQADFFRSLYDNIIEHGDAHESVITEKNSCVERIKGMGASSEDTAIAIGMIEIIAQNEIERLSPDQTQTPEI